MHAPAEPEEVAMLVEALDQAAKEAEETAFRERCEHVMRRARETVDRMSAEGRSLEDIARAIDQQNADMPAAWLMEEARLEVAKVKGMLTAGQDRAAVVETLMGEYPAFLRGGLLLEETARAVDACADELGV